MLATLTLTLPDKFFNFLPVFLGKIQLFCILNMLLLTITVLSKNKTSFDDVGTYVLGSIYVGAGFHYLAAIRNINDGYGLAILGFALIVVWASDIGAYVFGRKYGKRKLWPVISPNKTWEGSIGGIICAIVCTTIYVLIVPTGRNQLLLIGLSIVLSVVGQIGDLVESAIKRFYGVKDSGKILPGHGGILDRFDSLLFVLPVVAYIGIM